MYKINIDNLTKDYGNFRAVDNINININKKEIVGFVGKNGAGKSTTIRCMLNMLFPTLGTIKINNIDSLNTKKLKEEVAYVMGEPFFQGNITSLELFKFTNKFNNSSEEDILYLANYFELNLDKKINSLSLGNKKKVAIINALLKKASVIILDEPTSGLDPLVQQKLFDLLLDLKNKGTTIFLSSHNLQEIEKYCDKVAIIKNGKIVDYIDLKDKKIKYQQVLVYKEKNSEEITLDIKEDINILILKLSKLDLEYLEIKNKSIEEEFIDYYKG